MKLSSLLDVKPGLTAVIGGGGKTTLIFTLAEELKASGSVIICTSTRIWTPRHIPVLSGVDEAALQSEFMRSPVICVGADAGDGKTTLPACSFARLNELAQYILVEADGSRGLPMKAHAAHEPVIPDIAGQSILVIGASGFGVPIRDAAHRPKLYANLAGADEDDLITPERAARVALAENLHNSVFVNQVESEYTRAAAKALRPLICCPVYAGSLNNNEYFSV